MKKIVIDARMYGPEHAGIGRYVTNLLGEIKNNHLAKEYCFHLLVRQDKTSIIQKELGSFYSYHPISASHYTLAEQKEVLSKIKELSPDLTHFPHFNLPLFYGGRYVVTIHDLIKHFFRGTQTTTHQSALYWLKYLSYRILVRRAVIKARAVIVPTRWWKERLVALYRLSPRKIFVTWEGVDKSFLTTNSLPTEMVLNKYGLKAGKFFVYTGSVYPHKNVNRLIRAFGAFSALKGKELRLAIICSRNVFLKKLEAREGVKFLGFVPDDELKVIYKNAIALAQPSLMEGFGLTGLEAMACGCPVISSAASCLPEVYGSGAVYFDPLDEEAIKEKLLLLINNQELRQRMVKLGKERVKLFSWEKTAHQTLTIYKKVLTDEAT